MTTRITLRDVAAATGLHFTTVGLALRGDRRIHAETVEIVRQAAERLGYRRDAMLSALAVYRHGGEPYRGTIGWLMPGPLRQILERNDGYKLAYRAAVAAAEGLGVKVEAVNAFAPGLSPERLTQMLEARGIRALVLAPLFEPGEYPALPWEKFAVVTVGYSVQRPSFHRVSVHQANSLRALLATLRAAGYRRPGFLIGANANLRTGYNFLGAYLADQELGPEAMRLRPLVTESALPDLGALRRWLAKEAPDCVIASEPGALALLKELKVRVPERCGFVLTGVRPWVPEIAGMDERWDAIGVAAVDLVVSLLKNQETGVPRFPRFVLVEAEWKPGATVQIAAAATAGRKTSGERRRERAG